MVRNFVLAAAVTAGGLALAPTAASADRLHVGIGVGGPGYYGGYGYTPIYHRGYRHGWRRGGYYRPRGYGYRRYYRPRVYGYYGGYSRPRGCRTVTTRSWNGYRYVTRTRSNCGRRW